MKRAPSSPSRAPLPSPYPYHPTYTRPPSFLNVCMGASPHLIPPTHARRCRTPSNAGRLQAPHASSPAAAAPQRATHQASRALNMCEGISWTFSSRAERASLRTRAIFVIVLTLAWPIKPPPPPSACTRTDPRAFSERAKVLSQCSHADPPLPRARHASQFRAYLLSRRRCS